jgi:hypothetical protein
MTKYYYHNKHNPTKGVNDLAYELISDKGYDTTSDEPVVVYAPLYDCEFEVFSRRASDFYGEVEIDGAKQKRFQEITDENIVEQIRAIAPKFKFR